jgi:hypothetical protein
MSTVLVKTRVKSRPEPLIRLGSHPDGYMMPMLDERDRLVKFKEFGLSTKYLVKYPWSEAPAELQECCMHYHDHFNRAPDFVVVVPNAMRFSDLPEAYEIHQLHDGYMCFL